MKFLLSSLFICSFLLACNTSSKIPVVADTELIKTNDTISISNDALEYEVIIIEPGFNTWLESRARPESFYSQSFLETKNIQYVSAWNFRVLNSGNFDPNLYEMQINYHQGVDYGFEVNYMLYNYFIYFQNKYKQQLAGIVPKM